MYLHGFSSASTIIKDLATKLTTGALTTTDNWVLADPASVTEVTNVAVLKATVNLGKKWIKKEAVTASEAGKISTSLGIFEWTSNGGGTRVYVKDKRMYLYLKTGTGTPDVTEYTVTGTKEITVNTQFASMALLVDYESPTTSADDKTYYLKLEKPTQTSAGAENNYYLEWRIGEAYTKGESPSAGTFESEHCMATVGKLCWFKENTNAATYAKSWLPIEYWLSFDKNSIVGVLMGDPGMSIDNYVSTPFGWGLLNQIDGALETDDSGNFFGFSGSQYDPSISPSKTFGDFTATGIKDVAVVKTKSGRPYQGHKLSVFGAYEFSAATFNGQSAFTGKSTVTDMVVGDVNENDRGIIPRMIATSCVGKEHTAELIYNRYVSGKEETYIFLHTNAAYTIFSTSANTLLGIAIKVDI